MFNDKEYSHKLPLILLKSVSGRIETLSKMLLMANGGCFLKYRNNLSNGKPILRFGAAPYVFVFAVSSSLAALSVLFPA